MLDTSLPPALFDLNTFDPPAPTTRARWGTYPCHLCGHPLTRWAAMNSGSDWDGWYSWQLMEPAWDHLREHWATMRLLARCSGPIRNGHRA